MKQPNYQEQLREAYRLLVRRAALNQLELNYHRSQITGWRKLLSRVNHAKALMQSEATVEDREMAVQYCRFLAVSFETKFNADVVSETIRLTQVGQMFRLGAARKTALGWFSSIAGRSWLSGAALFLPLAVFVVWMMTHIFKVSGVLPMAAVVLAVGVLLIPVVLPVVLVVDGKRKKQLQMAGT